MSPCYRSGTAEAPRVEWFNRVGVWLDHRSQRIGIEDEDGVITWYGSDLQVVEVTDALDEEMSDIVERASRG